MDEPKDTDSDGAGNYRICPIAPTVHKQLLMTTQISHSSLYSRSMLQTHATNGPSYARLRSG